jgi:hypothetical protein
MSAAAVYVCPMHTDVKAPEASKCPRCGMRLVPQGAKHPFLRHMLSSPLHFGLMVAVMLAAMAAAMMLVR